jgi:hypothetical protein
VADKQYVAVLPLQDALRCRHIIVKRSQRVLYGGNVIPFGLQERSDSGPTRSIGKCAMNQNDVFDIDSCAPALVAKMRQSRNDACRMILLMKKDIAGYPDAYK